MLLPAVLDYKDATPIFPVIPTSLDKYARIMEGVDCFDWNRLRFDKAFNFSPQVALQSKFPLQRLGVICNIKIGGTPSRRRRDFYQGGLYPWVSIGDMNGGTIMSTKENINDVGIAESNVKQIKAGTTLVSFKLSIGKTAIAGVDLFTNEAIAALEIKPEWEDAMLPKYLFYLFNTGFVNLQTSGSKSFGKSLNREFLQNEVKIPVPGKQLQGIIIAEVEEIEKNRSSHLSEELSAKEFEEVIAKLKLEVLEKHLR